MSVYVHDVLLMVLVKRIMSIRYCLCCKSANVICTLGTLADGQFECFSSFGATQIPPHFSLSAAKSSSLFTILQQTYLALPCDMKEELSHPSIFSMQVKFFWPKN